jgi:hypothetical protein
MDIVYHPFILRGGVKPQRADSLSAGWDDGYINIYMKRKFPCYTLQQQGLLVAYSGRKKS